MAEKVRGAELARVRMHVLATLCARFTSEERAACEDAVQDGLEQWWRLASDAVKSNADEAEAWLYVAARNALLNEMRKGTRSVPLTDAIEQTCGASPAEEFEIADLLAFAKHRLALRSLPQITSVVWRDEYDLPYQTLSDVLGCSVNAAMIHHHRAMRFIARVIEDETGIPMPQRGGVI